MDDPGNSAQPQPTPPPPTHTTPSEPLPPGTSCCTCAYDLAGLDRGGNCPECGGSIAATLDLLASLAQSGTHVPVRQAKRLRAGLLGVALGVLLGPPTLAVAAFAPSRDVTGAFMWMVPGLIVLVISTAGWLTILSVESTPAPGFAPRRSRARGRVLLFIRMGVVATLALGSVGIALKDRMLSSTLLTVCAVLWVVAFVTHFTVLSERRAAMDGKYIGPDAAATWTAVPILGVGVTAIAFAAPACVILSLVLLLVAPLLAIFDLDRALRRHLRLSCPRPAKKPPHG